MTPLQLISQLGAKGIKLWLDEKDQLRFKAPKGAMSAELKAQIVASKDPLVTLLKSTQVDQSFSIRPLSRDAQTEFPLSFAQQRFWFLDRLAPGNPALHIPAAVKISGPLNLSILTRAFQCLIDRHEAFRTRFISDDTQQIFQVIDDKVSYDIKEDYDLSHMDDKKANAQVQHILKDEALKPFALNALGKGAPAFIRTRLIRLNTVNDPEQAFIFIINLHHIIADGWSMGLLIRELCHVYQALNTQCPATLDPLPVQYVDYCHWQKQWMQSQAFDDQLAYWQQQLNNVPILKLPTDYPRPDQASFHGDSITVTINQALTEKLHQFKDQAGCTLFTVLKAAWHILLMRHTEQLDFAVGIPVAGRKHTETQPVIGCFINVLAIRTPLQATSTLNDFLQALQRTLIDAQDHQDIPFETVAETINHHRNLSYHPIFQVLFSMQERLLTSNALGTDLTISPIPFRSVTAKYDLQLHIDDLDEALNATIEFNTDLFNRAHMKDLSRHLVNLLWSMVQAPDKPLIDLEIYDEADFQRFLPTQKPANEPRRLLVEQFEKSASKRPENIAVSQGAQSITYSQLHQQANALAAQLIKQGASPGARIAICLPPGIHSIVAILAVMKTAAAYVPMDTSYPRERLETIIQAAKPLAIITHSDLDNLSGSHLILLDQLPLTGNVNIPEPEVDYTSAFYTVFTSGSTGLPKGVSVSQANAYNLIHWYKQAYEFTSNDTFLIISALGFDLTQKNLLLPLLIGAEIVFTETATYDPRHISDTLYQKNISVLNCVPSAFYPIVDHCQRNDQMYALSSLEHLLFGGEPVKLQALKSWINSPCFHARIINMYGPTECTDISTTFTIDPVNDYVEKTIPIGQPIDGVNAYVLGRHRKLVPIGTIGELYIGGQGVAEGYLNQPELTAAHFIDDPFLSKPDARIYKTGDQVKYQLMPNGELQLVFVSRLDDQIKIRGYRIEPDDIANRLQQHTAIREAVVLVDRNKENERLLAYFLAATDAPVDLFQLRHYLKAYLPEYMLPQAFIAIDQWPLSANGKLDKRALPKPCSHHLVHSQYVAPDNLIEKQLCQLFSEKLAIEDVGTLDNFFELGGHSILATQLVGIIQNNFGVDLSVQLFFENPTIKAIASLIQAGNTLDDLQAEFPIVKVSRHTPLPLSQAQERLWIIEQMNPGLGTYLIPFAIRLKGPLQKAAFKQAFDWLTARHEALRTKIYANNDGMAEQHIQSPDNLHYQTVNFSDNGGYKAALAFIHRDTTRPFDWQQDNLFRAALIELADDDHILSMCMHHIIADGWSLAVLQKDLLMAYEHLCQSKVIPARPLAVQYADFCVWQRQYLQAEKVQGHISFWLQQLQNAPECLNLPTDRPRPAQQTFNGHLVSQSVPPALVTSLRTFSQKQGITHYHTLLSVYFLLLQKYAHQDDICIGTPIAGRDRAELQDLVGYFVNTVVIRNDLSTNPDFYELCQRTLDHCLGAFAHQDIPIEQVIEKLSLKRHLDHAPIAQVGFNLLDQTLAQLPDSPLIHCDIIELDQVVSKYDLTLTVIDQAEGMRLQAEYNTDLFDETTISRLLTHYLCLLKDCLTTPEKRLNSFDILSQDQLLAATAIDANTVTQVLPLNAMQKDMVLAQSIQPQSRANTLGYRIDAPCAIEVDHWHLALQELIDREPRLRSGFALNPLPYGEFAYQYELKKAVPALTVLDYQDKKLTSDELDEIVDAFIYQPSLYSQQRFFRYGLVQLPDDQTLLLMSCHHGILDGISVAQVAQLTLKHYHAIIHKAPQPDRPPAFDYQAYLLNNRASVDNETVIDFWQHRLSGCEPLIFPQSALSTADNTPQHRMQKLSLTQQEWQQITGFCRKKRTTPAIYLKMLYAILISNYCQAETDFYFTEFHAKRQNANQQALGCFFQQSPFIVDINLLQPEKTIDDFLAYSSYFQKRSKPFNALSKGMTQQISPQGNLQFMFNYYHFLPQSFDIHGQQAPCSETPPFVEGAVQFIVKAFDDNSTDLEMYYQKALFNELDFLTRLQQLNQQILSGVNTISQLKLLLHPEYMNQRFYWQGPVNADQPTDTMRSLIDLFEQQVENVPNNVAVVSQGNTIDYQTLNKCVNQLAHYLHHQGVGSNTRVAVCLVLDIDAIIAILAIIKAGGAYVPVDTQYPGERIRHMLQVADIQHVICRSDFAFMHNLDDKTCIIISENDSEQGNIIASQPTSNPGISNSPDDMLYVIFTSGSTGMAKGAAVTHQNEMNLLQWYGKSLDTDERCRFLVISSIGFDLTQKNLFSPLLAGGRLVLASTPQYDSRVIARTLEEQAITTLNCAPSMFYPLIEDHDSLSHLNTLTDVILGGEPILLDKTSRWLDSNDCNARITNHYGPTECTDIASYFVINKPQHFLHKTLPIGRPNDHVSIFIINPLCQLLPTGLVGEIAIGGKGVGLGYLNQDRLNQERFIANPFGDGRLYLTGDLGRWNDEGQIEFVARKDFQLKINGQRIAPGEIEHSLLHQSGVTDALVMLRDNQLVAYVTGVDEFINKEHWPTDLANYLPHYMIPKHFIIMDEWPLNAHGKVDRQALPPVTTVSSERPYIAPTTSIEKHIAAIIANSLNLEKVSIVDNFFDIGANSLSASRAMVQIRELYAVDIPLNLLFELTTIEKLAAYIKASQWSAHDNTDYENTSRESGVI